MNRLVFFIFLFSFEGSFVRCAAKAQQVSIARTLGEQRANDDLADLDEIVDDAEELIDPPSIENPSRLVVAFRKIGLAILCKIMDMKDYCSAKYHKTKLMIKIFRANLL